MIVMCCLHRKRSSKQGKLTETNITMDSGGTLFFRSVLTGERAEDLLLAGIRLLLPPLQDPLDRVQQAEHLGKVTEHCHLYQTGIWDQCGNQSKGHLVSQNGGTNSAVVSNRPLCIQSESLQKPAAAILKAF